jgi:hypothetical protein
MSIIKKTLSGFIAAASSLTFSACDNTNVQGESVVLSTDQRPDIADDRSSVHITVGTKSEYTIRAADLKALVSGIPDPDSGKKMTLELSGQYIFRVAQNPRTNFVAIGVRGLISYETDYSMVFVINPAAPNKPQLVKFVLPGKKPAADGSSPAFSTIRHMEYDDSGLLRIHQGDQSDARAEIVVNQDLSIRSCRYLERDAVTNILCGEEQ